LRIAGSADILSQAVERNGVFEPFGTVQRRFGGAKSGLEYLLGEKLLAFAGVSEFAPELPTFRSAVGQIFNQFEIASYIASRKPATRRSLRQLL
jgi:hypothetical protein